MQVMKRAGTCAIAVLILGFLSAPAPAGAAADNVVALKGGSGRGESSVVPPKFVHREKPIYPIKAQRAKKGGTVVVEVWIDTDGSIISAKVIKAAGWGFSEAALRAAKNSVFTPGLINGRPAKAKIKIPYKFVYEQMGK